jgi:hypothetical protein
VEKSSEVIWLTKIIFTIWNKDSPRMEIFRTLCNSYLKYMEQVVEKSINYPIS